MSNQLPPGDSPKRMSRNVKLVLMGVGAMALLYSCTPAVGAFRSLPFLWGLGNPFYRPPMATTCPPGSPLSCEQASRSGGGTGSSGTGSSFTGGSSTTSGNSTSGQTTSQRGGFGSSATAHGSGGSGS